MPIGFGALKLVYDGNTTRTSFLKQTLERGPLVIAPHPQFADLEIGEHGVEAVNMVVIGVRKRNHV